MNPDEEAILTPERVATVNAILHPTHDPAGLPLQHGGDLQPTRTRKRRSDAGVKKGPKVNILDAMEINIRVNAEQARNLVFALSATGRQELGFTVMWQLIEQQQKRIDALERQKEAK